MLNTGAGSVEQYRAPLFVAWQLTNHCSARCIACCEESGPDNTWSDELTSEEALDLTQRLIAADIPYVAFGGGEPLGVPHCWQILEMLSDAGIALKIETDGHHIDDAAADRLAAMDVECTQISIDGATAATHERVRPGSSFVAATAAVERLVKRGLPVQFVFVPNLLNIGEIVPAYDLAVELGCSAFVTGPMMRIGRAASAWDRIACTEEEWARQADALRDRAGSTNGSIELLVYPRDILSEMECRLENPQAMLLVVPNGKIKLLNALPFSPANLRHDSITQAWEAYCSAWRRPQVREFVNACRSNPNLLGHANETWPMDQDWKRN